MVADYLFRHPEVSNIVLFRYFGKTRHPSAVDFHVPEFVSDIARSMNLCTEEVTPRASMQVLAMMNVIFNFISGETFFRSTMNLKKAEYVAMVKETAKLILIPACRESRRSEVRGQTSETRIAVRIERRTSNGSEYPKRIVHLKAILSIESPSW